MDYINENPIKVKRNSIYESKSPEKILHLSGDIGA